MTTFAGKREFIPSPGSSPEHDGRVLTLGVEALSSLLDVADEEAELARESVHAAAAKHEAAVAELTAASQNVSVLQATQARMGENSHVRATLS